MSEVNVQKMAGPSTTIEVSIGKLLHCRLIQCDTDLSGENTVLLKDCQLSSNLATTNGILKSNIVNLLASGQPLDHGMITFGDPLTRIIKKNKYGYTNV